MPNFVYMDLCIHVWVSSRWLGFDKTLINKCSSSGKQVDTIKSSKKVHLICITLSSGEADAKTGLEVQEKEGRRNRVGRVLDCSKFQGGFSLADGDPSSWSHPLELFVLPFWVIGEISLQEVTPHRPCW